MCPFAGKAAKAPDRAQAGDPFLLWEVPAGLEGHERPSEGGAVLGALLAAALVRPRPLGASWAGVRAAAAAWLVAVLAGAPGVVSVAVGVAAGAGAALSARRARLW